jgi:hypothetical protein
MKKVEDILDSYENGILIDEVISGFWGTWENKMLYLPAFFVT